MYVQLKTGQDVDRSCLDFACSFSRSWRTLTFHGKRLRRVTGTKFANADANFSDIESGDHYWVSGPKRDRTDGRYSSQQPIVDEDARDAYEAILAGHALPRREQG